MREKVYFSCLFHAYMLPCLYPKSIRFFSFSGIRRNFQTLHLYTADTSTGNGMASYISLFLSQANHFFQ